MKRKFEVGDRVWNVRFGWGTVEQYVGNVPYPIYVVFDYNNETIRFTQDGKHDFEDAFPSLFFEEIVIPETALRKPKWRAKHCDAYYFVTSTGKVDVTSDAYCLTDLQRFNIGNYFKTEEDAKTSAIYKAFNGGL